MQDKRSSEMAGRDRSSKHAAAPGRGGRKCRWPCRVGRDRNLGLDARPPTCPRTRPGSRCPAGPFPA